MTYTNNVNTISQSLQKILDVKAFRENPKQFILSRLNERRCDLLNSLLYFSAQHSQNYASQKYLATYAGYKCRQTANRILKIFHDLDIVEKTYRHHNTCLYKVSDIFEDFHIRKSLQDILPALKWFPLKWLFVTTLMLQNKKILDDNAHYLSRLNDENVTLYTKELFLKSIDRSICACAYAREKCGEYSRCFNNNKLHLLRAEIEKNKRLKMIRLKKEKELAMKKELIHSIISKFGFVETEAIKLDVFPEVILELADKKLTRTLQTAQLSNPAAYFFTICKNMLAERDKAKQEILNHSPVAEKDATTGTHKDISRQTVSSMSVDEYKSRNQRQREAQEQREREIKESWRRPPEELLAELARVPESFRGFLLPVFHHNMKESYKEDDNVIYYGYTDK